MSSDTQTHDAPEIEEVDRTRIACDGGQGPLGHPRVWLSIPTDGPHAGWVECPYCDKRFVLREGAARAGH